MAPTGRRVRLAHRLRVASLLAIALSPGSSCVCADWARDEAYERALSRGIEDFRFTAPRERIVAAAREKIDVFRGPGVEESPGEYALAGPWSTAVSDGSPAARRVVLKISADGRRRDAPEKLVQIWVIEKRQRERRWREAGRERDAALELALLQRVEPAAADSQLTPAAVAVFAYRRPVFEVSSELAALCEQRGEHFSRLADLESSGRAETLSDEEPASQERRRHSVRIVKTGADSFRVEITALLERTTDETAWDTREVERILDHDMTLLSTVEPQRWAEIEEEAQQEGREAYDCSLRRGGCSDAGCRHTMGCRPRGVGCSHC
jgi:hypothetical protein